MKKNKKISINFNCFLKKFFEERKEWKEQKLKRDFMNLLAHEVKTPLSITLFHIDDLISDLDEGNIDKNKIKDKLVDTEKHLEKISVIINNIFQSQKNDIWNVVLNKEKTDLGEWLCQELKCFQNRYKDIEFNVDISWDVNKYSFDKWLMSQVISNIVWNAIKFANPDNKKIFIKSFKGKKFIYIQISDNWNWYPEKLLIDKYMKWHNWAWGLWLWLYLSEIIVKKHWWSIFLTNSQILGWAKLIIKLKK